LKNVNDAFVKYLQSDLPQAPVALMQFIYNNKITQSNIKFSVKGVKNTIHSNIALDIFFNKISQPDYKLPSALFESLAEDEQALFLEAPFSAAALAKLESYIYVHKENELYKDSEGYVYTIIQRSKNEVILEYADDKETIRFSVAYDDFILNQDSLIGALKEYEEI
jgi:hypothetical protein